MTAATCSCMSLSAADSISGGTRQHPNRPSARVTPMHQSKPRPTLWPSRESGVASAARGKLFIPSDVTLLPGCVYRGEAVFVPRVYPCSERGSLRRKRQSFGRAGGFLEAMRPSIIGSPKKVPLLDHLPAVSIKVPTQWSPHAPRTSVQRFILTERASKVEPQDDVRAER